MILYYHLGSLASFLKTCFCIFCKVNLLEIKFLQAPHPEGDLCVYGLPLYLDKIL